jgi:hypothetical protein
MVALASPTWCSQRQALTSRVSRTETRIEIHLRHEPTKVSKSRIKRLRELARAGVVEDVEANKLF